MRILEGSKGEKALALAAFGHDLDLDATGRRKVTLEGIDKSIVDTMYNVKRLDNVLSEFLIEQEMDELLEDKDTVINSLLKTISYSKLNSSIANNLGLDADKLAGSDPYSVNGVDLTVTDSPLTKRKLDDMVDMLSDFADNIGLENSTVTALIAKLEKASTVEEFGAIIDQTITSGNIAQAMETQVAALHMSNKPENNMDNTFSLKR